MSRRKIFLLLAVMLLLAGCAKVPDAGDSAKSISDKALLTVNAHTDAKPHDKTARAGILNPDESLTEIQTTEIRCENNGQEIYGVAYIPAAEEKVPLVIFAHELGNTHASGTGYAKSLAEQGIAVYTFDFRGGSYNSQSEGETTQMSVMTEASDLESVIEAAKTWDFVDEDNIFLLGGSQGGMASAVMAARNPDEIKGLMLLYPAFVIPDHIHEEFAALESVPDEFNLMGWIMVGRNYAADVWDYDLYGEMKNFTKPVLILHGDRDSIVDVSYSERAKESYPNAELHILNGAVHGFHGSYEQQATKYILDYLEENR